MPGNPISKSQRISALSEKFDQLASDFGKLLPPIYRYKGKETLPTSDARADAWATADHDVITAMITLHELCDVLWEHAKRPATVKQDEPDADVNSEVTEP